MNTSGMGYRILDERYALLECLAVSGIGEIYRGRDLELAQIDNTPSRILIHLLPSQYPLSNFDSSLEQAQKITQSLSQPWILPILTQGQAGDRTYLVLSSPESLGAHSVMSLPSQQLPAFSQLMQQFGSLVKTKHLPSIVDSALLITLPKQNNLYLLATAFLQPIHALRAHHTGLTLYKRSTLKPTLALSGIMAITLSTFAVEYRNNTDTVNLPVPIAQTKPANLASSQASLNQVDQAILYDRPATANSLVLPLALQEPLAALEPALVALSSTSIQTTAAKSLKQTNSYKTTTSKLVETETTEVKTQTTPKPVMGTGNDKPSSVTKTKSTETETIVSKTASSKPSIIQNPAVILAQTRSSEAMYYTSHVETKPVVARPKQTPTPTPTPTLSMEELIERANNALDSQNFGAKNGVLFYIRQIKIRDHLHPQVERLGRFVVMYQHEIARNMLKTDKPAQAHTLLNTSKRLIQELNLKSLNSAQQLLEHKSNQDN